MNGKSRTPKQPLPSNKKRLEQILKEMLMTRPTASKSARRRVGAG